MNNKEEISLKDIVLISREWYKYLLSKWLIIVIIGISFGVLGLLYAWLSKPKYEASLSFILANTDENGSGILGLASQFGIDLSSGSNDVFTGNNIIALMKSRKMVQQALLKKPANNNQSLLNIFCVDNELPESWKKNPGYAHVYPFPDSLSQMTPVQDSLFREIYDNVQKNYLDVSLPDKDKSIYNVVTTSHSEIFSYYLTTYIVDATAAFYIDTKTSVAQQNLKMLQREADSLRGLLGNAITASGAETDVTFNLNPAYQVQRSASQKSQAQVQVWGTAYGEVVKDLEIAKITLQKETPLYQILDEPSLPLKMETKSKLIYLLAGGFLGGILICCYLIGRKILKNIS